MDEQVNPEENIILKVGVIETASINGSSAQEVRFCHLRNSYSYNHAIIGNLESFALHVFSLSALSVDRVCVINMDKMDFTIKICQKLDSVSHRRMKSLNREERARLSC